ncbi:MAG: dTDP-4-dehydrorhamnose 3,5-epimerase family protein [Pseudomonadota bacterium]
MIITRTDLPGVHRIVAEAHGDERGLFARLYCPQEFAEAGIDFTPTQVNLSTNRRRGTLRGMHFQKHPFAEAKLVRVIEGSAWDVALDLRPGPTHGKWIAEELTAGGLNALFIPEGVAHGFLTLRDDTQILYQMGRMFEPGHGDGVRWDDPAFGIDWPFAPEIIHDKDRAWPDYATRADLRQETTP